MNSPLTRAFLSALNAAYREQRWDDVAQALDVLHDRLVAGHPTPEFDQLELGRILLLARQGAGHLARCAPLLPIEGD